MPKDTQLTNLAVNTEAAAFAALLDGGYLDIYDGDKPVTGDTAIGAQTLGVSMRFGTPAFPPPVAGVLNSNPLTPGVVQNEINPATWARCYRADHTTPVFDISVGLEDANAILPAVHLVKGVTIGASSLTYVIPKHTPGA